MKKISKEHIALIQLRTALELFNTKNYIAAITLAGAAEEILGQLSKSLNRSNDMELTKFMFRMTFPEYDYQEERLRIRNELKHHTPGHDSLEYDNFRMTAITHISGAIINYKFYKGSIPDEKIVHDYCTAIGLS